MIEIGQPALALPPCSKSTGVHFFNCTHYDCASCNKLTMCAFHHPMQLAAAMKFQRGAVLMMVAMVLACKRHEEQYQLKRRLNMGLVSRMGTCIAQAEPASGSRFQMKRLKVKRSALIVFCTITRIFLRHFLRIVRKSLGYHPVYKAFMSIIFIITRI